MAICGWVAVLAMGLGAAPVKYEISFPNAVHHEAEVQVTISSAGANPLELRMSRTSPGRYSLHEFAKNLYNVRATDAHGNPLPILRPNPHQWNVHGHDGTVVFRYTVYADHADGTYSGIDPTHAHLNMPATFVWAREHEHRPIEVRFHLPPASGWKAATQLVPTGEPGMFRAPDLYYFMDSPTELSAHETREWPVELAGKRYTVRLAVHHQGGDSKLDEYAEMIAPVVSEAGAVFGEYPEFDYGTYTFIADYLPWVFGDGMEHRNSTILTSKRSLGEATLGLLGTLSHEFFHAWNVERIRPKSLEPFDFEAVNMSGALWFAEGFTSYYGPLLLRRAGLLDDAGYAGRISDGLATVLLAPGRDYFSAVEMSMQAPFTDRATWVDATNQLNTFISYYTWGAALGLALDLTLRSRFAGLDLDDYMRAVWRTHGAVEVPYTLTDLQNILAELTGDARFAESFFGSYVRGREAPDFRTLLAAAGFLLRPKYPGRATVGWVHTRPSPRGVEVTSATQVATPLYEAGVDRGDVIVRLDGRRVRSAEDIRAAEDAHAPGDVVAIEYEGRAGTVRTSLTLMENRWLEVVPYEVAGMDLTPGIRAFREEWLGRRGS